MNTCDEIYLSSIVSLDVLTQNMFRNVLQKMALFPGWALRNKSLSTLKHENGVFDITLIIIRSPHYFNMKAPQQ